MRFPLSRLGARAAGPPVLFLHGGGPQRPRGIIVCGGRSGSSAMPGAGPAGHGDSDGSPRDGLTGREPRRRSRRVRRQAPDSIASSSLAGRWRRHALRLGTGTTAGAWPGCCSSTWARRLARRAREDPGVHLGGHAARFVEDFVNRRCLQSPPQRYAAAPEPLHNLRQMPTASDVEYDQRHRGRVDPTANERRRELLWSAVRRSGCPTPWCAGPRATCSTTGRRQAVPRAAPTALGSRAGRTREGDNPAGCCAAARIPNE